MSARDDYPDPCSTTDQDAMYEEIDELRSILGPLPVSYVQTVSVGLPPEAATC